MNGEPDRMVPADAIAQVQRLREAMRLVEEDTEGTSWIVLYGAAAVLQGACQRILNMKHVDPRARLPISAESQSRILAEFRVPDVMPETPE